MAAAAPRLAGDPSASVSYYIQRSVTHDTQLRYASAVASYRAHSGDAPADAASAGEWLAALGDGGRVTAATIRTYKSALRTVTGMAIPLGSRAPNPLDDENIGRIVKGIANDRARLDSERRTQRVAAPLTFDVVVAVRERYSRTDPRDIMHYAALTLAVATAARPSEVFGSRTHRDRSARARQVRFFADAAGRAECSPHTGGATPHHYEFTLEVSKTDQRRCGAVKVVVAPSAVAALWAHCCLRLAGADEELFTMGGTALTSDAALARLRRALVADGQAALADSLGGRSFRRGGASTLAAAGLSAQDIATLGWAPRSRVGLEVYANDPAVLRARSLAISAQMEPRAAAAAGAAPAPPPRR